MSSILALGTKFFVVPGEHGFKIKSENSYWDWNGLAGQF